MTDTLIRVQSISKKFCRSLQRSLWYGMQDLGSELVGLRNEAKSRLRREEFWALHDVSFELKRGECLGLVGRNGAGKTTLLRLLAGLVKPDTGRIEIRGRIGALIALGAGFNPILTGRENIYVNGAILGLSKRSIDSKMAEIIEFSELGEFIDSPVQSYSSGMTVRLGFSIAVALKPDILLVDEVLAVGDMAFRVKAYRAISNVMQNSAVIFVSHSVAQISKVCNRGMLLRRGESAYVNDDLNKVLDRYFEEQPRTTSCVISGSDSIDLRALSITSSSRKVAMAFPDDFNASEAAIIAHGESIDIDISFLAPERIASYHLGIEFNDSEGRLVAQSMSVNGSPPFSNHGGICIPRLRIRNNPLNKGNYSLNLRFYEQRPDLPGCIVSPVALFENLLRVQVVAEQICLGAAPVQLHSEWSDSASAVAAIRTTHFDRLP